MSKQIPFGLVPVEVSFDSRLNARHFRVLIALFSCRNRATGLVHPRRDYLSTLTNLRQDRISEATSDLVELGWLKKTGNGGRSRSCNYILCVPEHLSEQLCDRLNADERKADVQNDGLETPPEIGGVIGDKTPPNSGSKTPPKLGSKPPLIQGGAKNRQEQTIEQIKKNKQKEKKQSVLEKEISLLKSYGIVGPLAGDFILHRQRKKAAITLTAMEGFKREAEKAGVDLSVAVRESVERGWVGFKADWFLKSSGGKDEKYRVSYETLASNDW